MTTAFSDPAWATAEHIAKVERYGGPWNGRCCDECGKGIRLGGHTEVRPGALWRVCDPCYRAAVARGDR
jgi:hypothetical protein